MLTDLSTDIPQLMLVQVSVRDQDKQEISFDEWKGLNRRNKNAFSGRVSGIPLGLNGRLYFLNRVFWKSNINYAAQDLVHIDVEKCEVTRVIDSRGNILYPYGRNMIFPGTSYDDGNPALYPEGILDNRRLFTGNTGVNFSGMIDMYPLSKNGGLVFLSRHLTLGQLKKCGFLNADERSAMIDRLIKAGHIDGHQRISESFKSLEGDWGSHQQKLEKQLRDLKTKQKYFCRANGFEDGYVRIRVKDGDIVAVFDISMSRKELEDALLGTDTDKIFQVMRERGWAHVYNSLRFALRPEVDIHVIYSAMIEEFGQTDAQSIIGLLQKAREGKVFVADKYKRENPYSSVIQLLLKDQAFVDGVRKLPKSNVFRHIVRSIQKREANQLSNVSAILSGIRQGIESDLQHKVPIISLTMASACQLMDGLDAIQDDLDRDEFVHLPDDQKMEALMSLLSGHGFAVNGNRQELWRALPLQLSQRVLKAHIKNSTVYKPGVKKLYQALRTEEMKGFLNSQDYMDLDPDDKLVVLYKQLQSLSVDIGTTSLIQFYRQLPDKLTDSLSRSDIKIINSDIGLFDQVRVAVDDARMQEYLEGKVVWSEKKFTDLGKEERIVDFLKYARHLGHMIDTDYLANVYQCLPKKLSKNVWKSHFSSIEASLEVYEKVRLVIRASEAQEEWSKDSFVDLSREAKGDYMRAYLWLKAPDIKISMDVMGRVLPEMINARVGHKDISWITFSEDLRRDFLKALNSPALVEYVNSNEFRQWDGGRKLVALARKLEELGCSVGSFSLESVFRFLPLTVGELSKSDFYRVLGYAYEFEKVRELLQHPVIQTYVAEGLQELGIEERLTGLFEQMRQEDKDNSITRITPKSFYTMLPPWLRNRLSMTGLSADDSRIFKEGLSDQRIIAYVNGDEFRRMDRNARLFALVKKMDVYGFSLKAKRLDDIHTALPAMIGLFEKNDIGRIGGSVEAFSQVRSFWADGNVPVSLKSYLQPELLLPKIYIDDLLQTLRQAGLDNTLTGKLIFDSLPMAVRMRVALVRPEYRMDDSGFFIGSGKSYRNAYNFRRWRTDIDPYQLRIVPLWNTEGYIQEFEVKTFNDEMIIVKAKDVIETEPIALRVVTQYKGKEIWADVISPKSVSSHNDLDAIIDFKKWMEALQEVIRLYDNSDNLLPEYLDLLVVLFELQKAGGLGAEEILDTALRDNRLSINQAKNFLNYLLSDNVRTQGVNINNVLSSEMIEYLTMNNADMRSSHNSDVAEATGGIDFSSDVLDVEVNQHGDGTRVRVDAAQIKRMLSATGVVPVIMNIQPMKITVPTFLGEGLAANARAVFIASISGFSC